MIFLLTCFIVFILVAIGSKLLQYRRSRFNFSFLNCLIIALKTGKSMFDLNLKVNEKSTFSLDDRSFLGCIAFIAKSTFNDYSFMYT